MALTRRQREVLEVIRTFIEKNGYSPSLEEIGGALELSSVATVHKHVTHLVDKGLVRRVWNQNRSIELVDEASRKACVEVSVTGVLTSGHVQTRGSSETVSVSPELTVGRGRVFALRIAGDSMADEKIRDGDVLFLEDRRTARDGETVLAAVDGSNAVIRRIERDGAAIKLSSPEGASRSQVYAAERVHLHGVVVGLQRRYPTG